MFSSSLIRLLLREDRASSLWHVLGSFTYIFVYYLIIQRNANINGNILRDPVFSSYVLTVCARILDKR